MPLGIAGVLFLAALLGLGSLRTKQADRMEMEHLKQVYQVPVK